MTYTIHKISPEDAIEYICDATWGMAAVSPDGVFLWCNPAFCKILDAPPDLIIGTNFAAWTHPEDLEIDQDLARQVREGEIPSYTLVKRYIKRGSTPQNLRIVWGILSVSGKYTQQTLLNYRVQFQPLDPYVLPQRSAETSRLVSWISKNWKPVTAWATANWKFIVTAIFVLLSLMWGSSEKLLDALLRARKAAESVEEVLSPSSPSSPGQSEPP